MDFVEDIIQRNLENQTNNHIIIEDIMRIYAHYYNNRTSSISTEWEPDLENEFILSRIGFLLNDRPQATIEIKENIIHIIYHDLENIESKIHSQYIQESYNANKKIIKIQR